MDSNFLSEFGNKSRKLENITYRTSIASPKSLRKFQSKDSSLNLSTKTKEPNGVTNLNADIKSAKLRSYFQKHALIIHLNKQGWNLISQTILNKFSPFYNVIFDPKTTVSSNKIQLVKNVQKRLSRKISFKIKNDFMKSANPKQSSFKPSKPKNSKPKIQFKSSENEAPSQLAHSEVIKQNVQSMFSNELKKIEEIKAECKNMKKSSKKFIKIIKSTQQNSIQHSFDCNESSSVNHNDENKIECDEKEIHPKYMKISNQRRSLFNEKSKEDSKVCLAHEKYSNLLKQYLSLNSKKSISNFMKSFKKGNYGKRDNRFQKLKDSLCTVQHSSVSDSEQSNVNDVPSASCTNFGRQEKSASIRPKTSRVYKPTNQTNVCDSHFNQKRISRMLEYIKSQDKEILNLKSKIKLNSLMDSFARPCSNRIKKCLLNRLEKDFKSSLNSQNGTIIEI